MVKHRFRNSIKSLFRSHINSENEEQLKRAKKEIQDKVRRILKLVKEEHLEEDDIPLEPSKKESLVKFIEDFNNQYQSLYAKYDQLTDQLRKKISGRQEQGSFPSSSDSDSDYSSTHKDGKNEQLENEFQKMIDGVMQELAESKLKLRITCEEKEELSKQLDIAGRTEAELNQRLEDLKREKDDLSLEKDSAFLQIHEEQKIIESLRTMANQQKDEKMAVEKELEAVKEELSILQQQLEHAEHQMTNISHNMNLAEEENESLKLKLSEFSNEVLQEADSRIEELMAESDQLKEKLHDREREVSALIRNHEGYENEFKFEINVLQQEVKNLQHQKSDLEVQLEEKTLKILVNAIQIQTLKEKVGSITLEQKRLREDKENSMMLMFQREESFRETEEKLRKYQKLLEDRIVTLSSTIDAKDQAYQEIMTDIKESVNSVMTGMENVVRNFCDEYENYENCITNISHELQIAKNYVREMNKENERLREDKQRLVKQMQDKNKQELSLMYMVENLKIKANKEELDKKNLTKTVEELEKAMKEKDEDILELGEEKREAIRQLCLGIDYQRSRYHHLKHVLSMAT